MAHWLSFHPTCRWDWTERQISPIQTFHNNFSWILLPVDTSPRSTSVAFVLAEYLKSVERNIMIFFKVSITAVMSICFPLFIFMQRSKKTRFDHLQPHCWLNTYSVASTHPGFIKDWRFCCLWSAVYDSWWQQALLFHCQVILLKRINTARLIKRIFIMRLILHRLELKGINDPKKKSFISWIGNRLQLPANSTHQICILVSWDVVCFSEDGSKLVWVVILLKMRPIKQTAFTLNKNWAWICSLAYV